VWSSRADPFARSGGQARRLARAGGIECPTLENESRRLLV
jgi:hypothetical protein